MRVLLCERNFSGHRKKYLEGLLKVSDIEFFCYAPENVGVDAEHFIPYSAAKERSLAEYRAWIRTIKQVVRRDRIDVVHILDGDSIMRYFGWGFGRFKVPRLVITYHHFFPGLIRRISYLCMSGRRNCVSVAHTQSVREKLLAAGVKTVELCGYPAFDFHRIAQRSAEAAKKYWKLPDHIPAIGIVGGMCSYKNILPFLETLSSVKGKFALLICGKESDVTEVQIRQAVRAYEDRTVLKIEKLSEEEYELAIAASDIIFCIYSHVFDGASGPLTDGVCAGKMILSCAHGSLGNIVRSWHLGLTAECEDRDEVLERTEQVLAQCGSWKYDELAGAYRQQLMPEAFRERYREIYL